MARRRTEIWLGLIVVGIGLIPVAIAGLWTYMSVTAVPLHPNITEVQSVALSPPSPEWADAVEQGRHIVRAALNEQNLPGLSVAVGTGGGIVWAEGFGWADVESHVVVTPETSFRIGTASTVLTSAAVGALLESGRLRLDEPIQTYVPEFPAKEWPVTLRQLMAHVAGVPNDGGDEGSLYTEHCEHPADALQFLHGYERKPLFPPGTRFHFSSYGWIVVSAAVEAAAHQPFLEFVRTQVFEPLGMRDTKADSAADWIADRATPYFPRFVENPRLGLDLTRPIDYSCYAGSSVFLSTPSDLVRFGLAANSGKLLKPATVALLQTSEHLISGEETGYGLGWDLETVTLEGKPTRWIGHDGNALGGTLASFAILPEQGIVVAVISNTSHADTQGVLLKIAEAFVEHRR